MDDWGVVVVFLECICMVVVFVVGQWCYSVIIGILVDIVRWQRCFVVIVIIVVQVRKCMCVIMVCVCFVGGDVVDVMVIVVLWGVFCVWCVVVVYVVQDGCDIVDGDGLVVYYYGVVCGLGIVQWEGMYDCVVGVFVVVIDQVCDVLYEFDQMWWFGYDYIVGFVVVQYGKMWVGYVQVCQCMFDLCGGCVLQCNGCVLCFVGVCYMQYGVVVVLCKVECGCYVIEKVLWCFIEVVCYVVFDLW